MMHCVGSLQRSRARRQPELEALEGHGLQVTGVKKCRWIKLQLDYNGVFASGGSFRFEADLGLTQSFVLFISLLCSHYCTHWKINLLLKTKPT